MRNYYTDREVKFFLECILEARTRDEILHNIRRNRTMPPHDFSNKPLEKKGNRSPNTDAISHVKSSPYHCAIMSAAHATGEHPVKILHRLMRDHQQYPPSSFSFRRGHPTHPILIHHVLKKLGYKLKRVPRSEHGHFIHHHSELENEIHDGYHHDHFTGEEMDPDSVEEKQKRMLKKLNDDPKGKKKPFVPERAIHVAYGLHKGKKYIGITHDMNDSLHDQYVESATGKRHMDIHEGHPLQKTVHTFNLEHGHVHDPSDYDPEHLQVSHLFEVQKDLRHPRWRHEN